MGRSTLTRNTRTQTNRGLIGSGRNHVTATKIRARPPLTPRQLRALAARQKEQSLRARREEARRRRGLFEKRESQKAQHRQIVMAGEVFRKLLAVKQKSKDGRETVDPLVRVITLRRMQVKSKKSIAIFDGYQYWLADIAVVNLKLAKADKIKLADVTALFNHWDIIRKRNEQKHPEFFQLEKQKFATPKPVTPGRYRAKLDPNSSGLILDVSRIPEGEKTVPSKRGPKKSPDRPTKKAQSGKNN